MHYLKGVVIGIIGLFILPGAVSAQNDDGLIRFGAHFGVGVAGIQGPGAPDQSTNSKTGLAFGVEASLPFKSTPFAVVPGLNFIQKGSSVEAGKENYDVNLNYLQFPILAEVSFGDQITFFSQIGPYMGLLQQARREGRVIDGTNPFTGETTTRKTGKSIRSGINDFELGIKGGFGARIPFFNGQLGLRVLLSRGLTPVDKPSATNIFASQGLNGDVFNRVVNIRAQYRLPLASF
jgi:hypothetical protein